jgi:hypothetical protein
LPRKQCAQKKNPGITAAQRGQQQQQEEKQLKASHQIFQITASMPRLPSAVFDYQSYIY